jgi:uncharacterized membrane protein YgdD (TMEM256/DUF423 family)
MNQRTTLLTGIALAGSAVVLGAFGAHAFKAMLTDAGTTGIYQLAVQYQFYHAFALILAGLLMKEYTAGQIRYAAVFFSAGVLLFCGSLYGLSFSKIRFFGPVTPLGGVMFIVGWACLFLGIIKKNKTSE